MRNLKPILERLYKTYDFKDRIPNDPIKFPHRYKDKNDIEVVGFISSALAYGRVDLFLPVIEKILSKMGSSPYDFLISLKPKHFKLFKGIRYRFQTENDIVGLVSIISKILNKYGSLENLFKENYKDSDSNIGPALSAFMGYISGAYGGDRVSYGFRQMFPSPQDGSACKRSCLFLRWMVRDKDIDFGLWRGISKSKLIIPLDTHIKRVATCLGLTRRKSANWKMAVEITDFLKQLDPDDPLKYDFALCHRGIVGICNDACGGCELKEVSIV